jgi:hypothetical protein
MDKELYEKFLSNDKELAKHYAFDLATHARNKSTINYVKIGYDVIGDTVPYAELTKNCQIEILCAFPFDLRLDRLLVKQLGLSREQIKKLGDDGKIISAIEKNITKIKVKNRILLTITP